MGTQKPVPMDEPDDFAVMFRQSDGRNADDALKARESCHPLRMTVKWKIVETIEFAILGKKLMNTRIFLSGLHLKHFEIRLVAKARRMNV
jgi:hypothetical protein